MEPFKDPKDALTRKYMNEAGLDPAPEDTYMAIMDQITALNTYSLAYKPLISRKGWALILGGFVLFLIGIFWLPIERFYLNNLPELTSFNLSEYLSGIQMSSTTLYAIGFLGLFLVQLPFLKRLLDSKKA
ncbi:hypothetical protein [Gilvibacter sp.]|uniref:hypothetical protein n=1 Tax=Gilvibacter sp. TaxID=2729997 RepID=UPI0025BEC0B2|nr:hypothetical protein [Gilvibacter sp.]NQX78704.1 hypothetical protein [Gilvibacter sp.]